MKEVYKYTDQELLDGIKEKNNTILQFIIKQNYKSVLNLVTNNNGDTSDAQDILQETLIVLFNKASSGKFVLTSSLHTLIYSIARLMWLKELRRRNGSNNIPTDFIEIEDEDLNIEKEIEKNDRLRLYRSKFEELGEECKKLLRLFYLGTPMKQITKFLDFTSDEYTKKRKYKCKQALVESIKSSKQFKELGYGK